MMSDESEGPMPFTDSSSASLARLTSTAASAAAAMNAASAATSLAVRTGRGAASAARLRLQPGDVAGHAAGYVGEGVAAAGRTQPAQVGFGEALVLADQCR